jgi:uncharacterized protein DUF4124
MKTRLKSMLPLALALLSGAALAQFLYKSTMPDGKVIYGDAPTPGAVKVEKSRPDTSKKGVSASTPNEAEALRRMQTDRAGAGGGNPGRAEELEAQLRKMEAEREKFREPVEGERIGTVSGGGRFTDAYLERQKKYDEDMDVLRKEIEKARAK